jgi:hypothetical protein
MTALQDPLIFLTRWRTDIWEPAKGVIPLCSGARHCRGRVAFAVRGVPIMGKFFSH